MTDDLFAGHRPARNTRRGAWHVCQVCGVTHRAGRRCLHPTNTTETGTTMTDTDTDAQAGVQLAAVTGARLAVDAAQKDLDDAQARLGVATRNALDGEWTFRGLAATIGMSTGALQNWCRY